MIMIDPNLIDVPKALKQPIYSPSGLSQIMSLIKVDGLTTPLEVKALTNGRFQLLIGYLRHRAAIELGLKEVPVIVATTL